MTSTETPTPTWGDILDDLAEAEARDLREVADEATAAEKTVGQLEEQVRNGEDVKPGEIEAAEAAARHARLRLEAVRRKHAGLREQARVAHRDRVHDALAEIAAEGDTNVEKAAKAITDGVAKLIATVPGWNAELARLRAEAAAVVSPEDETLAVRSSSRIGHPAVVHVDGRALTAHDLAAVITAAVYEGVGGREQITPALGRSGLADHLHEYGRNRATFGAGTSA